MKNCSVVHQPWAVWLCCSRSEHPCSRRRRDPWLPIKNQFPPRTLQQKQIGCKELGLYINRNNAQIKRQGFNHLPDLEFFQKLWLDNGQGGNGLRDRQCLVSF